MNTLTRTWSFGALGLLQFALSLYFGWLLELEYLSNIDANFLGLGIWLIALAVFVIFYAIYIVFFLRFVSRTLSAKTPVEEKSQDRIGVLTIFLFIALLHVIRFIINPYLFELSSSPANIDSCQKYASSVLRDSCIQGFAFGKGKSDTSACDRLDSSFGKRDECYSVVALDSRNPAICTGHPNQVAWCKAQALRDPAPCDEIVVGLVYNGVDFSVTPQECKGAVASRIQYDIENPVRVR